MFNNLSSSIFKKKEEGAYLDEAMAHRFLEMMDNTHTVRELREKLTGVGIDKAKNVSLVHFLLFHYNVDWHEMLSVL